MTNRFQNPDEQFLDNTGTPYANGFLYFYASGTSNLQATYSDAALSSPNANPIVLDSAGRCGSVFLQNLNYKVILQDKNTNQIWSLDPVRTSDVTTNAQFAIFAGNPNGSVAGTAGSGSTPSSVIWDTVNNILYVCTTTGNAAAAVWTAVNAPASAVLPSPQGYLTLTSGTPVIATDAAGAPTVYYTPFTGTQLPIFGGSAMATTTFSELSLSLVAQHAANTIYDCFVFSNSGVLTLVTGPAWSNSGAGTSARGSGAGTTALARQNGFWANQVQITGRNGSTTYTIPANNATYVGSIYIDGTAGQISCHRSYSQNRKWGVWNAYNRQPIILKCGDPSASWNFNTNGTIRASNNLPTGAFSGTTFNVGGSAANGINVFIGLAEEMLYSSFKQNVLLVEAGISSAEAIIGVGYNSITAFSGLTGDFRVDEPNAGTTPSYTTFLAGEYITFPSLGLNIVASLEETIGHSTNNTYKGQENNMVLMVQYRG